MSSYLGFQPTTSSKYYFVSYGSEDASRVGPVVCALSQKLPLWYDYGLVYGEDWKKNIADHIENTEGVLLFLSKNVLAKGNDSYVYTEYQMAKGFFNKPIIIIQIDSITKSDIPNELLGWWIELNRYQNIIRQPYMTDESLANLICSAVEKDEKIEPDTQNTVPVQENPPKIQTVDTPVSVTSLLKRAFLFIEEGNWDQADQYLERVLDQDPENAQAYLGKLLEQYNVKNVQALKDIDEFTSDNLFYQRILRFGDKDLCSQVTESLNSGFEQNMKKGDSYLSNAQFALAERCYTFASKKKPDDYQAQWGLLRVKTQNFTRVFSHQSTIAAIKQDLDQFTSRIPKEQQIQYNDQFILPYYNNLLQSNQMSRKTIENALKAKETSQAEIEREFSKALEESKQRIKRLEADVSAKETICKQLRDSKKGEIPKNLVFVFPTIIAVFSFFGYVSMLDDIGVTILLSISMWGMMFFFSYEFRRFRKWVRDKKNKPINEKLVDIEAQLDLAKKYLSIAKNTGASRAKEHRDTQIHNLDAQYKTIDDIQQFYNKPSVTLEEDSRMTPLIASNVTYFNENHQIRSATSVAVGSIIKFGHYEQDNNTSNGKEDIEWLVLEKEENKALIISKYGLDCQQYNTSYTSVTWETSSLRKWLNSTFINTAFNSEEQNRIIRSIVTADKNPMHDTPPGNSTIDKVFLLSITEAGKYFRSNSARQCQGTAYCFAQGSSSDENGNCAWFLRSPGDRPSWVSRIILSGALDHGGIFVTNDCNAVRPALWIDLGS